MNKITMYVEEGLKQFFVATEEGWTLMPGSRFYVSQETANGSTQEPFAVLFDAESSETEVGLMVMAERTGAPFNAPYYVDRAEVLATGQAIADAADKVITAVLADHENDLLQLQADIEKRREEIIKLLGPMQ